MRAALRSLPLVALLIGAATGASAAETPVPLRDGIATQLLALGLDPVTVRADLEGLTRAERIVHLQSLGIELPTRIQLPEGQPAHALPAGNLATVV